MRTDQQTNLGAAAEAIQAHYDVGNEFYRLWLDPTLSYSCALWLEGEADDQLEAAQRRKLAYHAGQAQARGKGRVLDVGCGWGGLLRHLVEEEGVGRAVGLTLSRAQAELIASHPDPRIEARLEAWSDHAPAEPYDAVISVGAFEHFARPEYGEAEKEAAYRGFFGRCHDWLVPRGRLSLQTIAYGNYDAARAKGSAEHRFLAQEVFPESELPTLANVVRASDGLFEVVTVRNDREDYSRTCEVWFKRLSARKAEALAAAGEGAFRRYCRYLKLMAALFHYGQLCLLRVGLRRLDEPRW